MCPEMSAGQPLWFQQQLTDPLKTAWREKLVNLTTPPAYLGDHQDALVCLGVCGDAEVAGLISWDDGVHDLPVLCVDLIQVYGLDPNRFHFHGVLLYAALVLPTAQTHGQEKRSAGFVSLRLVTLC